MTTYGGQKDWKWTGSGPDPKNYPYLLDEPYARDQQAHGASALRLLYIKTHII